MNIQSITELNQLVGIPINDVTSSFNDIGEGKYFLEISEISKSGNNTIKTSYKYDFAYLLSVINSKFKFYQNEISSLSTKCSDLQAQIDNLKDNQQQYLPLSGGTITGDLYFKTSDTINAQILSSGEILTKNNITCDTLFGVATSAMWC